MDLSNPGAHRVRRWRCSDPRKSDFDSFGKLCEQARRDRIDLGARGFYITPGVDFNRETGRGTPFLYFTQGAAVAEV